MTSSGNAGQCDRCEECGTPVYQAGEYVSAGDYLRVDDGSFQRVRLSAMEQLPASFDGHIALYRAAAAPCACERRQAEAAHVIHATTATGRR